MGAAPGGGGAGCGAGAAAGVTSELVASAVYGDTQVRRLPSSNENSTNLLITKTGGLGVSPNATIATGTIAGSLAAALTSAAMGADDADTAKNVWTGSRIGGNAAGENATMIITGTDKNQKRSSSKDLDPIFRKDVEDTFGEKLIEFEWTGGNTKEARTEAAQKLYGIFENYEFKPGEKLNFVVFSHGGNDFKEFTQLYNGPKKIDNIIFLGTPHRSDYQLDFSDLSPAANRISIYSPQDGVQTRGYIDVDPHLGGFFLPKEELRILPDFNNIRVDQVTQKQFMDWKTGQIEQYTISPGLIEAHTNLRTAPIWDQYVKPNLK
jgi:hypothetical protein